MKKSVLFWDIKEEDLERVISCFDVKSYLVMTETNSSSTRESGPRVWVLSSAASSISSEKIFLGNREILTEVGAGDIFDEVYAVLADEYQSIAVVAVQPTEAAFFQLIRC